MLGHEGNQEVWVAAEALQTRPQANFDSQEYTAHYWQQQPVSSVAFTLQRNRTIANAFLSFHLQKL